MKQKGRMPAPRECPVCGERVPAKALACPECGADEESGWNEDAYVYDGLDLPDESFSYKEFMQREFGRGWRPVGLAWWWWLTGILVLAAMIWGYFR